MNNSVHAANCPDQNNVFFVSKNITGYNYTLEYEALKSANDSCIVTLLSSTPAMHWFRDSLFINYINFMVIFSYFQDYSWRLSGVARNFKIVRFLSF
jgi:hypothetical protein